MGRGQEPQANTMQDLPTGSGLAWEGYEGRSKSRSQRPWKSTWAQTKGIDREGAKAGGRRRFLLRHS